MTILPLLLSVALFQDPATEPAAPPPGARLDQVELLDGEVLEGRILLESGNYLEIELEPGAVVGFRTTQVTAIRRGAGAPVPSAAPAWPARDEWFTLHDGTGATVGWLHGTVTSVGDGSVRVQEEWEFGQGQRWYQVTAMETTDPALRPQSSYFRERVREDIAAGVANDPLARKTRVLEERIVEASVDGDMLTVSKLTTDGRSERRLPWPQDGTFPMLARAQHGGVGGSSAGECTVFDAAVEELQTRTFAAARQRRVVLGGTQQVVEEIVEGGGNGRNAVWRDASAHVLRREIAGPGLVAVPSDADSARRAVGHSSLPPAFVAESAGRFGLWRPNPAWEVQPAAVGTVALRCAAHNAGIALTLLDHLDAGASLDVAAEAVERWFLLLYPEQANDGRAWIELRGRRAVRIDCSGGTGADRVRATLHVVPWEHGFLVLRCMAPASAWDELAADFDAVAAHLELVPAAVALLQPADGDGRAGATAPPPPAPAVRPPAPVRVRVPVEQGDGR